MVAATQVLLDPGDQAGAPIGERHQLVCGETHGGRRPLRQCLDASQQVDGELHLALVVRVLHQVGQRHQLRGRGDIGAVEGGHGVAEGVRGLGVATGLERQVGAHRQQRARVAAERQLGIDDAEGVARPPVEVQVVDHQRDGGTARRPRGQRGQRRETLGGRLPGAGAEVQRPGPARLRLGASGRVDRQQLERAAVVVG
jgi:hypothetical protein